jgi:replicative DNA helicase
LTTITTPTQTLPPHNLDAEKSVLGAVLLDERHLLALFDEQLSAEHFYRPQHGTIFAAMLKLSQRNERIDHLTVTEQLREHSQLDQVGGPDAVEALIGCVPAAGNARDYARIVRDNAHERELLNATYEIQQQIFAREHRGEAIIEQAERAIFALRGNLIQTRQRLLETAVDEELDRLQQSTRDDRQIPGLATGIGDLDRLLGGLQDGRLYIVAARPSMGKSLLTLQIARHAALTDRQRVLFASLEMSDAETAQRHLAAESAVDPERLHLGQIRDRDAPAAALVIGLIEAEVGAGRSRRRAGHESPGCESQAACPGGVVRASAPITTSSPSCALGGCCGVGRRASRARRSRSWSG